jgi:hypothetical protein
MEEKASILRRFNAEREQLNTDMDRLRRQLGPQARLKSIVWHG